MQGSGLLEIVLLAMVRGFLVLRLRRVLGRRTGHQPPPERFPRDAKNRATPSFSFLIAAGTAMRPMTMPVRRRRHDLARARLPP